LFTYSADDHFFYAGLEIIKSDSRDYFIVPIRPVVYFHCQHLLDGLAYCVYVRICAMLQVFQKWLW